MKGKVLLRSLVDGVVLGLTTGVAIFLSFTAWAFDYYAALLWITVSLAIASSGAFFFLCFQEESIGKNVLTSILGPTFGFLCFYLSFFLLIAISRSDAEFLQVLRPDLSHGDALLACFIMSIFCLVVMVLRLLILIGLSVKILLHRRKMENATSFCTDDRSSGTH